MFYSHQLLARKAPLGQIWMAATMHAKINRRKLDKLNIINICEEILSPSVPMALRLSGILMGGVVIVYERKVKLFYEDVTRFLVEINEAWKVKPVRDPTILPKGKSHAKYEDVTLPDNQPTDLGEPEQPLQFSNSETQRGFQRSAYTEMKLDSINEAYISQGKRDFPQDHHQANIDDITMCDKFNAHQTEAVPYNLFERFDIDGDDETRVNSPFHDHTDIPSTLILSPPPPPPNEPQMQKPDEIHEQHPGEFPNHQVSDEDKAQHNRPPRQRPTRRIAKRMKATIMDHGQTIIPGQMYQSWLQDASDIASRRGLKRKPMHKSHSLKIARLMDLPPVALVCGLVGKKDLDYPPPLLKLWTKSIQPPHDSPSGNNNSPPHPPPPPPSSSSPPEGNNYQDQISPPFENQHGEVGSGSLGVSIEHIRENIMDNNDVVPPSVPIEKSTANHANSGVSVTAVKKGTFTVAPSRSGEDVRSKPSAEFVPHGLDVNSGRSNKKRLFSSSRRSGNNLEPVLEELSGDNPAPDFKLHQLSENENDLMVETGPTQTQKIPIPDQPLEQLTDSLRMQLKMHFDSPGSAQRESLDQLALGLNRKAAAGLFYQTCVLATRCLIRVEQKVAYGDISISRGAKM